MRNFKRILFPTDFSSAALMLSAMRFHWLWSMRECFFCCM